MIAVLVIGAVYSTFVYYWWKWLMLRRHPAVAEHRREGWTIYFQKGPEG